ncbi:hypothetical protein KC315_g11601 [Hortaea werneckii]|nr:hypothetical protein KC315_g11601 [Hortaea werneckii]KAI7364802.1 hypothetical protein KC354_g5375 [Hortaea werneckii]
MASTQEKIALRNENIKKVLPFINSNRGNFSGRAAQETALDGFLQGTDLFKFQTGSKVKIQHSGKTLRDQLKAAINSKELASEMELGIEDTANPEVEQSTDRASGAASNSEQSSSARATSMWPAEQQQPASSSQHESQPQHHPALDKVGTDSSRESPMTEVLGGEVPASPPNRKRKNRQEPEGVEGMPPIKSPRLASEVSSERTAASPIRKRKLDTAGLEPEQEEGRQASKSPRLDLDGRERPFEAQAAVRRDARKSSEPSARSRTIQNSPSMGISSQSMVPRAPDAPMAAGLSSKRQALANTLETSPDDKGKAGAVAGPSSLEYHVRPGESLEARDARLTAIEPRHATNKDLHAGRVQAPLRNVRERHAEAIGKTLLDHLYPPEVEPAGPLAKNIHLVLLRQGHDMIQKCMFELTQMMHWVVSSFARENDLNDRVESAFVQQPSQELEELYSQVFGSKEWRAAWLDRLNRQEPCIYRMPMVLSCLIGATIHREVFQKETPWDVEQNLRSGIGYAVKALEEAMGDRGHSFRNVVKHAQFKLYDSKEFQDETIEPYARKIADSLAMTLVPHLIAQKKHQYPNAEAHFFEAPCVSDEWVRKLREVFKFALILHGKINGANDATYEYIWFKPGSIWDGQQRSVDVPVGFPRKPYEVILTWLPAIKVEYLPGTIRPEAEFASPARCWLDINGERAGVAGKSTN